jgi:exopolysaccharide production protein ExoQ
MNNVTGSFVRNAKVPWGTFVLLAAVFFVGWHDLLISLREAFYWDLESSVTAVVEGSLLRRVVFSMLGLFGAVGLMRRGHNRLGINGVLGWLILVFVVWMSLSVAWADDVALTSRRLMVLWMLCLGALAVGKRFFLRDIILWVFVTATAYLLIGVVCEIALGTFRPFAPGYRFAGTVTPNSQGVNCCLLLFTGIASGRAAKRGRWFFLVCSFAGLGFLVLTGSRTAFADGIAALLVYWALVSSRSRKAGWLFGISIGVCVLLLLVGDDFFPTLRQGALLGRTDKDTSSITDRMLLWKECLDFAARQPLQGYGYDSFFTPSRIGKIGATQGWPVYDAHSAYLQLLLGTGVIGMISFVLILVLGIKKSFVHFSASLSPGYACFIAILVFCSLQGFMESMMVMANMSSFVVMVVVVHLGFTVPSGLLKPDLEKRHVGVKV